MQMRQTPIDKIERTVQRHTEVSRCGASGTKTRENLNALTTQTSLTLTKPKSVINKARSTTDFGNFLRARKLEILQIRDKGRT